MIPERILVTGATGFVGGHFLRAARAAFPKATLLGGVRPEEIAADLPGAHALLPFDLLAPELMRTALAAAAPNVVVHLAAFADIAASFTSADLVWRANVDGTRSLAAMLQTDLPDCLLLNVGSADCYGLSFQSGAALDETASLQPANPYAAAKAAADMALGEIALRGLRVVRVRPVNHIGPGQTARFAVASFARQVARIAAGAQPPVIQTGALNRWRDFLHVRDVCDAYIAIVRHAESLPRDAVYNIASGAPRRIGDVLDDLIAMAGIAAEVREAASERRPIDVERAACNSAAARAALAWAPRITWPETLAETLGYWTARVAAGEAA